MPDERVIATTRELSKVASQFNKAVEAKAAPRKGVSPIDKRRFQAQLARAMRELEKAEKVPAVMSTPQNQLASLLQSMVTQNATHTERLHTDVREAKFDTNDWLG